MKKGIIIVFLLAWLGAMSGGCKKKMMDLINPPPQSWAPDLDPVLVYNPTFAQRFGLDPNKAVPLETGVLAVAMTFRKHYEYNFYPEKGNGSDAISVKRVFDQITRDEWYELSRHLAILPLLFPNKYNSDTLDQRYFEDCKINFYLDSSDPRVAQVDMQPHSLWVSGDIQDVLDSIWYTAGQAEKFGSFNLGMFHMTHQHVLLFRVGKFKNFGDVYDHDQNHLVNFLPGITFISFSTACDIAKDYPKGTVVWFEKKGGPDYFRPDHADTNPDYSVIADDIHFNPNDFVSFHITMQLTRSQNAQKAAKNTGN